jgi:trimethylamine:corrinoid methyltransferase-like protein
VKALTQIGGEVLTDRGSDREDEEGAEAAEEARVDVEEDLVEELDLAAGVHPLL